MVRDYVAVRRKEIRWEADRGPAEVFAPQTHMPGDEAEVDFGDVHIVLAGVPTHCYLFSLRLSYSGKAVHQVSASCGQEAFFEGHVHALNVLGGVPRGKVRYDNLKAAVAQVLRFSRQRTEPERWIAFRSRWGIDSFHCRPGTEGAHEKGGVEGQIGYFRRNHFVPVPEVGSLAELNEMVDRWDLQDEARRIRSRPRTVGEYFALEQPLLKPLPVEPFEMGRWFTPRVDRYGQITVRTNRYSVPVRLIGRTVRVLLHASELVVFDDGREVARHERLSTQGGSRLVLDHYLEALVRKPGAFPGSTALEQARAAGRFTQVHDAWWDAARAAHGDKEGTQALIQVLLLARHIRHEHLMAGLAVALRAGALTADAVALEARKAADGDLLPDRPAPAQPAAAAPGPGAPAWATVTFLTEWRLTHLPPDTRPLPSMAPHDQPLRRRRGGSAPSQGEGP
ncbi:IS21 family transposase [Streptomyces olivoreticuli]|uniref:Mu transposase domain-containing protein n=1 Tax=Streptomyces olivoreticuli TaxID=68246 RepID=UPI002658C263|nr:IS21 family transposase [Streptomyces olivoreticuli]WKK23961.1 IS21 family transposase [Streptomyces olivoreticuli]